MDLSFAKLNDPKLIKFSVLNDKTRNKLNQNIICFQADPVSVYSFSHSTNVNQRLTLFRNFKVSEDTWEETKTTNRKIRYIKFRSDKCYEEKKAE